MRRSAICSAAAASAASDSSSSVSRSTYVSRLRKAFLLRAHPDRYRSEEPSVRRRQADLVQAMADRMANPDFVLYMSGSSDNQSILDRGSGSGAFKDVYNFFLQRNDGTPMRHTIRLNDSPERVLGNMAKALQHTGVAGLPKAPPPTSQLPSDIAWKRRAEADNATRTGSSASEFSRMHGIIWAASRPKDNKVRPQEIDHRFDVNAKRGRDLFGFLRSLSLNDIEERKASRIDASAAALVARRSFGFQAIDGTGMGWSSASLAILLSSLTALHDEHKTALHVNSFYPMRLVISYDDDSISNVDLHGGVIRLHPAATPVQWLEILKNVTQESLAELERNQAKLKINTQKVQDALNIKLKKGKTCSSPEYHGFVQRLAEWLDGMGSLVQDGEVHSDAIALARLVLVVEADQACRRAKINNDGTIRVGAGMSGDSVYSSISRCSQDARIKVEYRKKEVERAKEIISRTQNQLGLSRVYHEAKSTVTLQQVIDCLMRLMKSEVMERRETMKLAGQSLGITGSGHFCHLSDDGSVVIPWDWR
mmetsp:Transcript_12512/g.27744  ORF Transcript_12512/g.27744 Transcript_12512/m.27744 type:complete len:537 (+) Transcript_12512:145-1755(+)